MKNEPADETNPEVSMVTDNEIPPTPSQPTPSKSARAEAKQARKEKKAAQLPTTPSAQSASKHSFPEVSSGTKQASAPVTPNHEGSLTPGGRPKSVRGPRIREKDSLRIGFYTPEEVEKIETFKINFCTLHGLSGLQFDEMIQHSDRAGGGDFPVSTDVITKVDFWNEIYGLVPGRDRRSVYRFMRRHFQSSTQKAHDWSEEQEDELISLLAQHGPKWAYIGRLLGRSDDDVTQRWKNKLEHKGIMNRGSWAEDETYTFLDAMKATWVNMKPLLGEKAGKDFYDLDERLVIWGNISKAMNHKRSRQQCADKWRKVVKHVKTLRANGIPDAEFDVSYSVKTAANWNTRLPANKRSDEYVKDSDDDDAAGDVHGSQKTATRDNSDLAEVLSEKVQAVSPSEPNGVTSETDEVESPKKPKKSKSKRKHAETSSNDHTQLEDGAQAEEDSEPELPPPSKQPKQRHTQNGISDIPGELPSSSAISTKTKAERKREKKEKRAKAKREKREAEAKLQAKANRKAARKEAKRTRREEEENGREEETQSPELLKEKGKEAATKSKEGRSDTPDSPQRTGESSQAGSPISSNVRAAFIPAEAARQSSLSDEEDSSDVEIKPEYDSDEL